MATRVLVIERNAALRRVVVDILETLGYAALGSDGALDARALASTAPPDVAVVADLRDGDIADLIRFLRRRSVLVVAACSTRAAADFVGAGAHCTIRKPVSEGALRTAMRWVESVYLETSEPKVA